MYNEFIFRPPPYYQACWIKACMDIAKMGELKIFSAANFLDVPNVDAYTEDLFSEPLKELRAIIEVLVVVNWERDTLRWGERDDGILSFVLKRVNHQSVADNVWRCTEHEWKI